jgi:hypothetical protein
MSSTIAPGTMYSLDDIRNYFSENPGCDFEVSGSYTPADPPMYEFAYQGEHKIQEMRESVDMPKTEIIWHTHPPISKYYPSTEDLVRIIKQKHLAHTSIIFTAYGVWVLKCNPPDKIKDKPIIAQLSSDIQSVGHFFYHRTNKGTEYDLNIKTNLIPEYIKRITQIMNRNGIPYSINWYEYEEFDINVAINVITGGKKIKNKTNQNKKVKTVKKHKKNKKTKKQKNKKQKEINNI